ncbi:hypothetical protein LJC22_01410 [Desulfosarcina sp. OttesenSCG-928-G10]|nr:hypothetical protein [Desulfosarcina sp. OttesenSCG-928-G10]
MKRFKLRYIYGFQSELKQTFEGYVEADSLQAALRTKSDWPIEVRYNCTSAWAKNPGTSLYYVEAWEAECCAGES